MHQKRALIVSITSDIGAALALHLKKKMGWKVYGTYRTLSPTIKELELNEISLFQCDLSDTKSVKSASEWFIQECSSWDLIIVASGSMQPIGLFSEVKFDEWETALQINCLSPLRIIHHLLPYKNCTRTTSLLENSSPTVLFFAGSGSNGVAERYSSYTVSKIALTKMCELLEFEEKECRFAIVGPGWVKTKIHQETLSAQQSAGPNYEKTLEKLNGVEWTSMQDVIDCCQWVITSPCLAINGRNFSVVHDCWGTPELENALTSDAHMYKLRRCKNEWNASFLSQSQLS